MAITKTYNVKSKSHLNKLIDYTEKEEKTESILVSGFNCNPYNAYDEMITVKEMYDKSDGRQGYQIVQSFAIGEVSPEEAHEIGKKLTEKIAPGYQVILATHLDRDHIHNHIVINSINMEYGYKYDSNAEQVRHIRDASDNLCREYNLSVIEQDQGKGKHYGELRAEQEGRSWKSKMKDDIDFIREYTNDKEEFINQMEKNGYKVTWTDERKYISIQDCEGHNLRTKTLGEKYTKEAIENEYNKREGNRREGTFGNDAREPISKSEYGETTNINKGFDDSSKSEVKRDEQNSKTNTQRSGRNQESQSRRNAEDTEDASRGTSKQTKRRPKKCEYDRFLSHNNNREKREERTTNDESILYNDSNGNNNIYSNNVSDVQEVNNEWIQYEGQQDKRVDKELIDQARKTNLKEYLENQGYELDKTGNENIYKIKDTETYIEIENNKWKDLRTKESGNTIDYVMKNENYNFRQAVERITDDERANEIIERPSIEHEPTNKYQMRVQEEIERQRSEQQAQQQVQQQEMYRELKRELKSKNQSQGR